ncbi:hypothetical protein [Bacteroides sp.]
MKRNNISIYGNTVTISGNNVWMTDYEIAEFFIVPLAAVNSHIKSTYKSGVLRECDTCQYIRLENGNRADAYNIEMITALAFQLNSINTLVFRKWLMCKATTNMCQILFYNRISEKNDLILC